MKLATIGYENDTQAAMIDRLKQAGVKIVLDVRAVASSRKAGFSKNILAASLAEAGIDYVHLQKLGTPKIGRDAARAGRIAEMRRIYEDHLADEPAAQVELVKAGEIASARKAALLCYEADYNGCHRTIVAQRLHNQLGLEVENL
jgi:uncharacterized protein (DUF488 family)